MIYKYPLKITDEQSVDMPTGAKILSVQMQGKTLCLWASVNPENKQSKRTICIVGTGNPFDEDRNVRLGTSEGRGVGCVYLGTVQDQGFVWHVFEKLSQE